MYALLPKPYINTYINTYRYTYIYRCHVSYTHSCTAWARDVTFVTFHDSYFQNVVIF